MSTSLHNLAYYGTLPLQYGVKAAAKAAYCCNLISKDTFRLLSGKSEAGFLEKTGRFLKRLGNAFVRVFKKEKPQSAWTTGGASLPSLLAGAGAAAYYRNEIAQVLHPILSSLGITKPAEAAAEVAHHIGNALSGSANPAPQQAASSLLGTAGNLAFNRYTFGATGLAAATAAAYHSGIFGKAGEYISKTVQNTAKDAGTNLVEGAVESLKKPTVQNIVKNVNGNVVEGANPITEEVPKTIIETVNEMAQDMVEEAGETGGAAFVRGACEEAKSIALNGLTDLGDTFFQLPTTLFNVMKAPPRWIRDKWNGV